MISSSRKSFVILFLLFYSQAQGQILFSPRNVVDFIEFLDMRNQITKPEAAYVGSPFLNEEFINADIYYNHEYVFKDVPMRYDIYGDEMQYQYKTFTFAFKAKPEINYIVTKSDTFVIDVKNLQVRDSLGFFRLLTSGKLSILSSLDIYYKTGQPPGALMDRAVPEKFIRRPDIYYAKIEGSNPVRIKSTKMLIGLINDRKPELTEFAKREKISTKASDLARLAKFYNSLQ